jgi:hypothetical protein
MKTTRDHTEFDELRVVLGLEAKEKKPTEENQFSDDFG